MKFFLTGGSIRDEFLSIKSNDNDYFIIDADKKVLRELGYIAVGNKFEVFIHPKTKEEYVLAYANDINKELERRDLTINSIARNTKTNEITDPFNGVQDLENKILRHTSKHFCDDPIRILRLARLKAKLTDFTIADETDALCRELSLKPDLFEKISPERFLLEFQKALKINNSNIFFETLKIEWAI